MNTKKIVVFTLGCKVNQYDSDAMLNILSAGGFDPPKVLGPASTEEESQEAPEQLAWGLAFPEATREGP